MSAVDDIYCDLVYHSLSCVSWRNRNIKWKHFNYTIAIVWLWYLLIQNCFDHKENTPKFNVSAIKKSVIVNLSTKYATIEFVC